MRKILLILSVTCFHLASMAQDLGSIDLKNPVKLRGSLNSTFTGYSYSGQGAGKRDPFSYTVTGSLGISILDWSIPLSFAYSSRRLSYAQPFNRIGLSPRYKWVRLYGGYTSMSFSNYSLSGHSFLGGGFELSPGPWRVAAMYGQLKEKVAYNEEARNTPCFKRMGYGVKFGYEGDETGANLSLFTAKDDLNSIKLPSDTILKGRQNLVVTLQLRQRLWSNLYFDGEYGRTVLTNDLLANGAARRSPLLGSSIKTNSSTIGSDAFNVSLGYRIERSTTELKYERVNPGYETLGGYYANNNFDNLTVGQTISLKEGKINLAANVGVERNNLNGREQNSELRMVGSLNASYAPNEKWSFNSSYSNFTGFTRVRPKDDPFFKDEMDSLSFYQVNQTATLGVSRMLGDEERRQMVMFSGSYQRSSDKLIHRDTSNLSNFYNGSVSHSYSIKALALSFTESFTCFYGNGRGMKNLAYGPFVSVNKQFYKGKVSSALSCGFNYTELNGMAGGKVLNAALNASYSPQKKREAAGKSVVSFRQRFTGSMAFIKRFAAAKVKGGHEFTAIATYSISF